MLLNGPVTTMGHYAFSYDAFRILAEGVQVGPLLGELSSAETTVTTPDRHQNQSQAIVRNEVDLRTGAALEVSPRRL
jgi:hypothetical protein